ncbi:hypothetical protein D0T66_15025 [Dysgonomonas sp. 25]|nr:hypothetical protein [Dysgonomonas sp. 25]
MKNNNILILATICFAVTIFVNYSLLYKFLFEDQNLLKFCIAIVLEAIVSLCSAYLVCKLIATIKSKWHKG